MATTSLFDEIVAHQIGLERAKAGEVRKIRELIAILDGNVLSILSDLPDGYTRTQLNTILFRTNSLISQFYSEDVLQAYDDIARTTARMEISFAARMIAKYLTKQKFVPTPNLNDVMVIGNNKTYQQKTLSQWTVDLSTDKINRVNSAALGAAIDSLDSAAVSSAVKKQFKVANSNADTITRSYVNQFTNVARDQTYQENTDFVNEIVWSTILDHRTTVTCGARSNKRYNAQTKDPIDHDNLWEGGPGHIHFNCRSVAIPINASGAIVSGPSEGLQFDEGERAAIGAGKDYERGDDRNKDGSLSKLPGKNNNLERQQVPANLDYETWLRRQPKEFIEDVLGPGKAELFIDEKMSLEKFVVPDGRELTLQQLETAA